MALERHGSVSPSPSRRVSFSNKLSALGAKLTRTLTGETVNGDDSQSLSSTKIGSEKDRSLSRGRDVYQSSGRGGIGNIRQASSSREARPDGPDDFSSSRGREPATSVGATRTFSTGRGGAGNIRSPSRDISKPPLSPDPIEEEVILAHAVVSQDVPHSTGRGGIGNITRSRSRGPLIAPVHSTGRGGAGNMASGDVSAASAKDDEERKKDADNIHEMHSTGRGGAANLTAITGPDIEHIQHTLGEYESTGRGGAGNIIRDRSSSRTRGS